MESISFTLNKGDSLIEIGFEKFNINVLLQITMVLDVRGYDKPLTLELDFNLFEKVKEVINGEYWLINFNNPDQDVLPIKINGFDIIFKRFKRKQDDAR